MSKYIEELGEKATLGDLFEDLHQRASKLVGGEGNVNLARALAPIENSGLELEVHTIHGSKLRNRDGHTTYTVSHYDAKAPDGQRRNRLISTGYRVRQLAGRDDPEPESVGAFESTEILPSFSIHRNPLGIISLKQSVETDIPGQAERLGTGIGQGGSEQTLGSLRRTETDAEILKRASVVSSAILRGLYAIEAMTDGSTLEEAFANARHQPLVAS